MGWVAFLGGEAREGEACCWSSQAGEEKEEEEEQKEQEKQKRWTLGSSDGVFSSL